MSHAHRFVALGLLLASSASAQIALYSTLNGAQEVPPIPTLATGVGRGAFNEDGTFTYSVKVVGLLTAVTAAHVHLAAFGVNGGVVFGLAPAAPAFPTGTTEYKGTSGVLTAAQRNALLTDGCYFNVHTQAFPGGEVRGQILGVRRSRYSTTLTGGAVVPMVVTGANGAGEIWLHEPENVLSYDVDAFGLPPTATAALHSGAPGINGALIAVLGGSGGAYCGMSAPLSTVDVASLKAGNTYVVIQTLAFPAGEIRGQVVKATELFTAFGNGAQEVPAAATAHTGCGTFVLNTSGTLTYNISTTLPGPLTGLHLHTGVPGQSGGVTVALSGVPPTITGTTGVLSAVVQDTLRRGNLYFNLHTAAFPGGEVRGQVRASADPFGFGSPDLFGGAPRIGGSGYAGSGSNFSVTLFDAAANQNAVLWIGTQELFWPAAGVPLPFHVPTGIGVDCAVVWTDWDTAFFFTAVTDANGCASYPISIPALPVFDCLKVMFQWFVTDPNANPFGQTVSDALLVRVAQATLPF